MTGPLAGVRVIDASTVLAGPMACQILGDYGADVVKIEHPARGDTLRSHGADPEKAYLWWKSVARNKRCIGLDLGDSDGAAIFLDLVRKTDVVVENFRPGTMERWGLGPDRLHEANPGLVLLRVTGFGQTGPYAHRPGFGTLAEAMSGFAAATGEPDGPPTLPPFGLADTMAAMSAAAAVAMALYHRDVRDGTGQVIDLSILEPIMTVLGPQPTIYARTGELQRRTGNRSDNNAPRKIYRTKDDRWVAVSTSATSVAERVMRLVGHPEVVAEPWFATGHGRAAHGDLLDRCVSDWIAQRTHDEVIEAFEMVHAAVATVYGVAELLADPQVKARDVFPTVEDEELGPLRMQNVLFRMSATPGSIRFAGRPFAADTDEVLGGELGISAERLAELRGRGVVA